MNIGHVLSTLFAAALVAAGISLFLMPKLEQQEQQERQAPATQNLRLAQTSATQSPTQPATNGARRTATLSVRPDGHYWARALVNKRASVEFMVDTGASVVALSLKDAKKMGFKPHELDYKWEIRTAGGITYGASVVIDSIKINQVHIRDVEAMVLKDNLDQSLLGMSFLRELYSYEFRGERMIIKQ